MQKKIFQRIFVITFWDVLMFYQIFFSSQAKRIVIINNKHSIYKLPNNLRLRILGNQEILRRSQMFVELQSRAHSSPQNEYFVNTSGKLFKNWNWTFLVVRYFTLTLKFVSYVLARIVAENPLTACCFLCVALPSCEVLSVATACFIKGGVDVDWESDFFSESEFTFFKKKKKKKNVSVAVSF